MVQTKVDSDLLTEQSPIFLLEYGLAYWVGYIYVVENNSTPMRD